MCNLSKGVEEKGIAKGLAQGRAEGRAEGLAEAIKKLMDSMGWPVEQAMSALQIPEADRQAYIALMKE